MTDPGTALRRWSVCIRAEGDHVVELDAVVALADAVAVYCGIACGVGQRGYGAQVVVIASARTDALRTGLDIFDRAVASAGLPAFPIAHADAMSEETEAELRSESRKP